MRPQEVITSPITKSRYTDHLLCAANRSYAGTLPLRAGSLATRPRFDPHRAWFGPGAITPFHSRVRRDRRQESDLVLQFALEFLRQNHPHARSGGRRSRPRAKLRATFLLPDALYCR